MSKRQKARASRGFTLIELLVVISIIGLLSTVVLATLNPARLKGRDTRRLDDMRQIRIALEMYQDDNNNEYPDTLAALSPKYMPNTPSNPSANSPAITSCTNNGGYCYANLAIGNGACTRGGGTACKTYVLGVGLETGVSVRPLDNVTGTIGGGADSVTCSAALTAPAVMYCIQPQ